MNESNTEIISSTFTNCTRGGARVAHNSTCEITDCSFKGVGGYVVGGHYSSKLFVKNSTYDSCNGNCICYEHSGGRVDKCTFNNCLISPFSTSGIDADPVFTASVVNVTKGNGAVIRDLSRPVLYDVYFFGGDEAANGMTVSDFSNPTVLGCWFEGFPKAVVASTNGSTPSFIGCYVTDCGYAFDSCLYSLVTMSRTIIRNTPVLQNDRSLHDNGGIRLLQCFQTDEIPVRFETEGLGMIGFSSPVSPLYTDDFLLRLQMSFPGLCRICGERVADVFASPCGHRMYCSQCAEQTLKEEEDVCPICLTKITKFTQAFDGNSPQEYLPPLPPYPLVVIDPTEEEQDAILNDRSFTFPEPIPQYKSDIEITNPGECLICTDAKPDVIALPCGHSGLCYSCLNRSMATQPKCPFCSAPVRAVRHIFPAGVAREERCL